MTRTMTDDTPTAYLLYTFYEGHIDDPVPIKNRRVKFRLVADLFAPPWTRAPMGIPYEVSVIKSQLEGR